MILFSVNAFSQDISGTWRWFEEEDKSFEIYLEKPDPNLDDDYDFMGTHCGVFLEGRRMDCTLEDFSIFLKNESKNIFIGKITSAYSLTDFEIRLTYFEEAKEILWEVTKKGEGQSYFPFKVILTY
jgi:hypothetical protein